jgi:hypothetical protein
MDKLASLFSVYKGCVIVSGFMRQSYLIIQFPRYGTQRFKTHYLNFRSTGKEAQPYTHPKDKIEKYQSSLSKETAQIDPHIDSLA